MRHVTLVLEYFHPWTNAAGFLLARERGWYQEAGLEVEIRTFDPYVGDALEYLHQRRATFGVVPTNRLLVRRESGRQLLGVAAVNQRGLETLRTRADSGIHSLADLAGRRIAYNPTPRGHAMVRSLVAAGGSSPGDYVAVDAGPRELDPADRFGGLADATFGSYWAWDNLLGQYPAELQRAWRVDEALGLGYHSYLLAAHEDTVDADPGLVHSFLHATGRGFTSAREDPDHALRVLDRLVPYFPVDVLRLSLQLISPTWFHHGRWGVVRPDLMTGYAQWLVGNSILRSPSVGVEAVRDLSPALSGEGLRALV